MLGLVCSLLVRTGYSANILMVVGNSNNTVPVGELSIGDAFVVDYLETELNHQVEIINDFEPRLAMQEATGAAHLVLIVESVTSMSLGTKLKDTPTPILNYEAFIQDEMGMTEAGSSGDPGPPTAFANGVLEDLTQINIVDEKHPLAAGLTGAVTVYQEPKSISWGIVAPSADVVATLTEYPEGAVIYVYEQGDTLFDNSIAAGLRVGFFLEDDNETGTPNLMTEEGLQLFEAAVDFSLGNTVSVRRPVLPLNSGAKVLFVDKGAVWARKENLFWNLKGMKIRELQNPGTGLSNHESRK